MEIDIEESESQPRSRRRARAAVAVILVSAVTLAFFGLTDFAAPQGKPYAASYKVQQMLLGPWLNASYLGSGGPSEEALLCDPMGLAIDESGDIFVADRGRKWRGRVVWRFSVDGTAHVVAGSGRQGDAKEGPASEISFGKPEGLAVSPDGRVHIADAVRHAVYRVEADGLVTRVAGTGSAGSGGDGGPASEARLNRPAEIRFDSIGNLYIADVFNHRVRMVDRDGIISTVAGTGEQGSSDTGGPATETDLDTPWGIGIDLEDRLLVADADNHRILRVEHDGTITTIAGNGRAGYSGDGGSALAASFDAPQALFVDADGLLFVGDEHNHAVRVVASDGTVSTLMGTGERGVAEPGAPAFGAPLNDPENLVVRPDGSIVITEGRNGRILSIDTSGVVRHVAGKGSIDECTSRIPGLLP